MVMRKIVLSLIALACFCVPAFADPQSVIMTAVEAASKHDYDTAIRITTGVIEDPATPPGDVAAACFYRGVAYFRKGDNKAALRDLDHAIQINSHVALAFLARGEVHGALGEDEAALADFSAAITLEPGKADGYYERGMAEYGLHRGPEAIADLSKAVALDPSNADAWVNRGENYQNAGQFDKAVADYNMAIERDPKMAMAYNDRATVAQIQGRDDDAIADFNKALAIDPRDADILDNLGWIYYTRGDFAAALAKFDASLRLKPDNAPAYSDRGDVHFAQGDFAKAADDYASAIAHDPDDMASRLSLYIAKARLGAPDKSVLSGKKPLDGAAWPDAMALYFLGKADMAQLDAVAAKQDPAFPALRICQRDYLLGEDALGRGDKVNAKTYFTRLLAACTPQTAPNYPAVKREMSQMGAAP
jgi:Tfp pilus assembly protein PilF